MENRAQVLLAAILVVLLLLTGGMATGAVVAFHEYRQFRQAFGSQNKIEDAAVTSRRLADEIGQRQAALSAYLKQRSEEAERDYKKLRARRDDLGEIQKGPLQKFDQALQFIQLLSDQVFLLERQITEIEMIAGTVIRPLPLDEPKPHKEPAAKH